MYCALSVVVLVTVFSSTRVTANAAYGCVESKLIKGKTVKGATTIVDTLEECLEHCRQVPGCVSINYNTKKKCNPKTRLLKGSDKSHSLWTYCPRDYDPCEGVKCKNGGQCSEGSCVCTDEYFGDKCQFIVPLKDPEPEPEPEIAVLPPAPVIEPEIVVPPPVIQVLPPPRPVPEVEVLPPTEPEIQVLPPAPAPEKNTNCGGHKAVSCAACPEGNGAAWCNGDCSWADGQCVEKASLDTNCGGHKAVSCAACPEGNGAAWCNGDCSWADGQCVAISSLAKNTNCGGHKAVSCKECPEGHGAAWCNGDCAWVTTLPFGLLGVGECRPK